MFCFNICVLCLEVFFFCFKYIVNFLGGNDIVRCMIDSVWEVGVFFIYRCYGMFFIFKIVV